MRYNYEGQDGGQLIFAIGENQKSFPESNQQKSWLTILWNTSKSQSIELDGAQMIFPENAFLSLTTNNQYELSTSEGIVSWQYNRDFYCILDHDKEVSCAGFLFYGAHGSMLIQPPTSEVTKFNLLVEIFKDEYQTQDTIQGEMLRMLLKRLIIKLTRIGKEQHLSESPDNTEYDLIRRFNLLVEEHYKEKHQVQDYALILNKSPKTLSNLFSKYKSDSPLKLIQERIALEGKRLIRYSDKSAAEIGYELGFEEPAHFSRFFKKLVGESPSSFRKSKVA